MSSAAEATAVAPDPGNVCVRNFFYEVSISGPINPTPTIPPLTIGVPVAFVKRHSLAEFGSTTNLCPGDSYLQAMVNQYLNMYKYFRYKKITCHFKPSYNFAPLTGSWTTEWDESMGGPPPGFTGKYNLDGSNQLTTRCIRKVIVNTDNTDWNPVATLNYARLLQTMVNTIRGTTIAELSWSYVPKIMTPMLQDFQTQGTPAQLRKVESGGQWLPTKYYNPGTTTPAGFNPISMIGFDLIIYDPTGRQLLYAAQDQIGWLEFFVEMEFSILDNNAFIGPTVQADTTVGASVVYAGTVVSTFGQANFT